MGASFEFFEFHRAKLEFTFLLLFLGYQSKCDKMLRITHLTELFLFNTTRWILALGILQTPKWPSFFLGLRQNSTLPPISLQKFSPRDCQGIDQQQSTIIRESHILKARIHWPCLVPSTKYGAFKYYILNLVYYYSNDLFFHFKMPLKRRNSLIWNFSLSIFSLISNAKELAMKNKLI